MKQEFITVKGKVDLNEKRLLIQDLRFNFWKTAIGEILFPCFTLIVAFFSFFNPGKPFGYFATFILMALFFSNSFKQFYSVLFKKSYSGFVPVNRIVSFELKPNEFGLETEVRVHLKNGRYRSIAFRTLEKQYEPFTELLTHYIAQPQLA